MQIKAKRKLKNITFDSDNAHIALVSKDQGGPANDAPYALVLKNLDAEKDKEFIEKVQAVTVTMELPDFLQRYFYLMENEADMLAAMLGYVAPAEDESAEAVEEIDAWFKERFSSYEIMKSLNASDNVTAALAKLKPQDYLSLVQDQQVIEKAWNTELDKEEKSSKADTSATNVENTKVEASASNKKKKKETNMTQATAEMVEKSAFVELEKSLENYRTELQKAQDQIKEFQEAAKQAIVKSKTEAIKAVIKDEKQAEVVTKAALALESDEDFNALVEVVKAWQVAVESSDLFVEKGASGAATETKQEESGLSKLIKQKYNK